MRVHSVDREIKTLLTAGYYKIPRFQRPYSWDKENVEEFWTDTVGEDRGDEEYFIGSMVMYPDVDDYQSVVDGQQRLTTIIILLSALRDVFGEAGLPQLAVGTHNLIEKTNINNEKQFVVSTESSYPYFQQQVLSYGNNPAQTSATGPEEKNIQLAYELLKGKIKGLVDRVRSQPFENDEQLKQNLSSELTAIRDRILSLKLILVELANEDDAYVIFETLNTRGKDLTVSDLLRNYFTRHLRPENREDDSAKIRWEKVLETMIDSSADLSVDTYLHHFWLSKYSYVTLKKLFKEIKSTIRGDSIEPFLDQLVEDAPIYRQIHETSYVTWTPQERAIRRCLDALQLFRVRQQTPFVLSLMRDYRNGPLRIKQLQPILNSLESFHFLFNAVTQQRGAGGVSKMYVAAACHLAAASGAQDKQRIIRELLGKIRNLKPSEEEFQFGFREILYTNNITKNRLFVRYILSRFDEIWRPGVTVDYSSMTIEHLYPQSPAGRSLPEHLVGMIGNLILVDRELNNRLSNRDVLEKLQVLRDSGYPLDDSLKSATSWDETSIRARTDYLAKLAYEQVWQI